MNETSLEYLVLPRLELGRVFHRAFTAFRRHFVFFTLASLCIAGAPQFLLTLAPYTFGLYDTGTIDFDKMARTMMIFGGLRNFLTLFLQCLLQGTIIHACIRGFNGEPKRYKLSLAAAWIYLGPLAGFAVLSTLGMAAGFAVFFIPGVIFTLMWAVGVPAMMMEETGVFGAFSRSNFLTRGYKWWILLMMIILAIVSTIIGHAGGITAAALGGAFDRLLDGAGRDVFQVNIASVVIISIARAFAALMTAVCIAALYYELRLLKEGIGPKALADVFD